MKKDVKRIGLDFDDVIIDHTKNKILLAKKMGFNIKPEETPGCRLKKIVGEKKYREIQKYIYGAGTAKAPMAKEVDIYLKKFLKNNFTLFLISRRDSQSQIWAKKWLTKHLPFVFKKDQIFFVKEDKEKGKVCQKLKIKIFLDNKVSVLQQMPSVSYPFLFDPYYIREDFDLKNIQPVSSWREFWNHVNSLQF